MIGYRVKDSFLDEKLVEYKNTDWSKADFSKPTFQLFIESLYKIPTCNHADWFVEKQLEFDSKINEHKDYEEYKQFLKCRFIISNFFVFQEIQQLEKIQNEQEAKSR